MSLYEIIYKTTLMYNCDNTNVQLPGQGEPGPQAHYCRQDL
jgi:hypothetical protein